MASPQSVSGGVITAVGIAMVALSIFADDLPFAPDNLFLPIMLILFGRAISRHQRQKRPQPDRAVIVNEDSVVVEPRVDARRPPRRHPEPEITAPASPEPAEPMVVPEVIVPVPRPLPSAEPRTTPTYQVRTSEDMIAEAKERLRRKSG